MSVVSGTHIAFSLPVLIFTKRRLSTKLDLLSTHLKTFLEARIITSWAACRKGSYATTSRWGRGSGTVRECAASPLNDVVVDNAELMQVCHTLDGRLLDC